MLLYGDPVAACELFLDRSRTSPQFRECDKKIAWDHEGKNRSSTNPRCCSIFQHKYTVGQRGVVAASDPLIPLRFLIARCHISTHESLPED